MTVLLTGFITCLALIMAIGAQSAWLLRQGLRRDRVGLAILTCLGGDIVLIGLGTLGVGAVLDHTPWLMEIVRWLGVTYLVWFAVRSFASARATDRGLSADDAAGDAAGDGPAEHGHPAEGDLAGRPGGAGGAATAAQTRTVRRDSQDSAPSRGLSPALSVIAAGLMVSLLNPHAWVDTMVVIGSMATSFGAEKWVFSAGAVLGSLSWFVALGYGGRALAGVLNRPRTWQIIDLGVGLTMLLVAGLLAFGG